MTSKFNHQYNHETNKHYITSYEPLITSNGYDINDPGIDSDKLSALPLDAQSQPNESTDNSK